MSAADPLHARDLVVEDALHSRGFVLDDRELLDEQHELEQDLRRNSSNSSSSDRKGKGRAATYGNDVQDGDDHSRQSGTRYDEEDDADESGYLNNHGRNARLQEGEDIPLHHRHRRRGSHPPSSPSAYTDPTSTKRARSSSLMGGLLEKNKLPEAGTSKRELKQMYIRRIAINVLFIMAWWVVPGIREVA